MAVFSSDMYLTDQEILKLSIDDLMTVFATNEYPWASFLGLTDVKYSGSDTTDYWLNSAEGLVKTAINDSGGLSGGAAHETITVDSTASFVANNTVIIAENGGLDPQVCRISAIGSATTMTVYTLSGDPLSAHADDTVILLSGDWVKYGDTVDQPLRLPTRDSNTVEQISVSKDMPENVRYARQINGNDVEAQLAREMADEFKQKVTMATLFGYGVTAPTGSGKAKMNGLINLIPSANDTSATFTKEHMRDKVGALQKRGAFPASQGLAIGNQAALTKMYGFDDSTTGISERQTDRPYNEVWLGGVRFRLMMEPAMNDYFATDKARLFLLTPTYKGKKMVRFARVPSKIATGSLKEVLETTVQATKQQAVFGTFELIDPRRHGLFQQT